MLLQNLQGYGNNHLLSFPKNIPNTTPPLNPPNPQNSLALDICTAKNHHKSKNNTKNTLKSPLYHYESLTKPYEIGHLQTSKISHLKNQKIAVDNLNQ